MIKVRPTAIKRPKVSFACMAMDMPYTRIRTKQNTIPKVNLMPSSSPIAGKIKVSMHVGNVA